MRTWIKRGLIAFFALLALAVVGVVVFVTTLDPNRYKGQMAQMVKEKKNRTLTIEGDVKLTLFPRLGLELGRTSLSDVGGTKPFLSLERANFSLALRPLLSKRFVIDQIRVQGLRAELARGRDGKFNFDDLLEPSDKSSPIKWEVDGVEVGKAHLSLRDELTMNTVRLADLNLRSGPLAERRSSNVELSTRFSSDLPPVDVHAQVQGRLFFDTKEGVLDLKNAKIHLNGVAPATKVDSLDIEGDLAFDTPKNMARAANYSIRFNGVVNNDPASATASGTQLAIGLDALSIAGTKLQTEVNLNGPQGKAALSLRADALKGQVAGGQLEASQVVVEGKGSFGGWTITEARLAAPQVTSNLAKRILTIKGMQAKASGLRASDPFELSLDAPAVSISGQDASGSGLKGRLALQGSRPLTADFTLDRMTGSAGRMTADWALNLSADAPQFPVHPVTGSLTGKFQLDLGSQKAAVQFAGKMDQSHIEGEATLPNFTRPDLQFSAKLDQLNLDRYLGEPDKSAQPAPAQVGQDQPIDLSGLRAPNLQATLKIDRVRARGVQAEQFETHLQVAQGKAELKKLSARLYGGTLSGTASLDAFASSFTFKPTLSGIQMQPFLKDLAGRDTLSGKGSVTADIRGGGKTVSALKKSLTGQATLQVKDGAIKGFNLAQSLRDIRTKVLGQADESGKVDRSQQTDFSELKGQARIENGVAHLHDVLLKSPMVRVTEGNPARIDVAAGQLDVVLRAMLVNTSTGQGGKELKDLKDVTIPVHISGPFDAWSYRIQWASISSEAVKQSLSRKVEEKLQERLQGKAASEGEPAKPPKDQLKDSAKEALKGLFKR